MAWSPFQRANAGIIWVEQPGDYANPIPTTSATGPWWAAKITKDGPFSVSVLSACARESSRVPQFGVALVIGNSAYAGVGALTNPKDDAALVAETLGGEGFKVTLLQDAKHDAMLKALRSFSDEADQADWALVYYAGHGIEVGGVNYLLPIDVELREDRDAEDEAISLDRVLRAVAKAHKLRLVVLDACRNNPFTGLIDSWCKSLSYNGIIRARSNSTPARPYMARLRVFSLLICPSVCPLLQGSDIAFRTASRSWRIVFAKRCIA